MKTFIKPKLIICKFGENAVMGNSQLPQYTEIPDDKKKSISTSDKQAIKGYRYFD